VVISIQRFPGLLFPLPGSRSAVRARRRMVYSIGTAAAELQ